MSTTTRRLLVVDDDDRFRERLARALRARGFEVHSAATLDAARGILADVVPDALVLDLRLAETWTLAFVDEVRTGWPEAAIIVLTGYGSIATAVEATRRGASQYLTKPVEIDQLVEALGGAPAPDVSRPETRPMSLARLEWEHINRVLTECGGNVSEAARVLGLHRRSLQRKLAKFPMPR